MLEVQYAYHSRHISSRIGVKKDAAETDGFDSQLKS
jgi:hypothetical protein